jgi:endoglucanase
MMENRTRDREKITRRALLKSAAALASATIFPFGFAGAAFSAQNASALRPGSSKPDAPATNPKWYGFNLLEYFSTDPDWMKYFPYKNDGMFLEDDFRWIRDWGFNWVRLPMDYRFWTDSHDPFKIHEESVVPIDRAIRLGEKYGIHVNVCLHRAPGFCVLDTLDEALTGIHITKEKTSVYADANTQDAFIYQWTYFADRYKGISSDKVSFNLVNEPLDLPVATKIGKAGEIKQAQRHLKDYVPVARAAIEGIRKRDPQRLVISDGYLGGTSAIPELFDAHVMQSCHTYNPVQLTHYQCEWARAMLTGSEPEPTWPLKDSKGKVTCDREILTRTFQPWGELAAHGTPIHFGEMGCYKLTPPQVVLAWFSDTLSVLSELQTGWALWNFRGPFGVLDTERAGTKYEKWHDHQLDRPLLSLLQQRMKS